MDIKDCRPLQFTRIQAVGSTWRLNDGSIPFYRGYITRIDPNHPEIDIDNLYDPMPGLSAVGFCSHPDMAEKDYYGLLCYKLKEEMLSVNSSYLEIKMSTLTFDILVKDIREAKILDLKYKKFYHREVYLNSKGLPLLNFNVQKQKDPEYVVFNVKTDDSMPLGVTELTKI